MLNSILSNSPLTGSIAGVNGVVALFDASDAGSLLVSSGTVKAWASKYCTAVGLATGSQCPAYSATARNGTPGVVFDGVANCLRLTNIDNWPRASNPSTMIVAGYVDAAAATGCYAIDYGSPQIRGIRTGGAALNLRGTLMVGNNSATIPSSAIWSGNDGIVTASFPLGKAIKTVYDAQGFSSSTTALTASTSADYGNIGADINGASYLKFICQCIVVFSRELIDLERQRVEGWAAWKFDPSNRSALGVSHPYKITAPG